MARPTDEVLIGWNTGRPMDEGTAARRRTDHYRTRGGITVHRTIDELPVSGAIEPVLDALDGHRGVLFASSYEYPGRYTRWDMGFVDPPIALVSCGRDFRLSALNARGGVLLAALAEVL